ncbi:conserved hypothetical protein [Neospora caninum Liverpool]|uniref:Uncharacterized protein n=1 Tax=Neospora caninum (strain Liverpool) TaxID=572307 RepID=F0VL07_NEOCL|nr:conserved hypothetical protein [Neospora caninum Liverpool]CBZ54759.1 conserved hypothetical protein [Neospora caninum Liverpool]CEL69476.1 TPA: hypothetical protein BN1204_051850 [Neospora caninum Liverpool]|eukprot:XP_003884787.1 conserved hypothetical protein [Neospora caninum Liverpool]
MVKRAGKQKEEKSSEVPEAPVCSASGDVDALNGHGSDDGTGSRGGAAKANLSKGALLSSRQSSSEAGCPSSRTTVGSGGAHPAAGHTKVHSANAAPAGGTGRPVKKQRKTESSSPHSGTLSPRVSPVRDPKPGEGSAVSPASALPPLPCWAKQQRQALEALTDEFYARHRLYLRVWPVTASEEGTAPHKKKVDEGTEDEATKLRQEQLMNMRVMLHDRVAENLSFTRTQYNSPTQPPRNRCLPAFLRPRAYRCLNRTGAETSSSATPPATEAHDAADTPAEGEHVSQEDSAGLGRTDAATRTGGSAGDTEPLEASGEDKINELQKSLLADGFTGCWVLLLSEKYVPPTEEPGPAQENRVPERTAETEPASRNGSREGHEAASEETKATGDSSHVSGAAATNGSEANSCASHEASPQTPRVRRVIVCGALIEVYSNNERQISALWCLPCLSAESTRVLLQAFLPRLVIEALKLPDILPPPLAKAEPKRPKKRQKAGKHENGSPESELDAVAASLSLLATEIEETFPPAPMKSVYAVCEDTLLWPRQALFLLASPSKMDFLRHVEPLQPAEPAGGAEPAGEEQPQLHVDGGLGPQWRECNCRRRFLPQKQSGVARSRDEGTETAASSRSSPPQSPTCATAVGQGTESAFLRFFSVSELWAARLMPPKEARGRLDAEETARRKAEDSRSDSPETGNGRESPGGGLRGKASGKTKGKHKNTSVWPIASDGWSSLVPRETCERLIEEIYGGMPYLRQYFDEDPAETNVAEDEMCGLTEDECRTILQW